MSTVHAIGGKIYCYERATIESQFDDRIEGINPQKKVWFLWDMSYKPKEYLGYFMTRRELLEDIHD